MLSTRRPGFPGNIQTRYTLFGVDIVQEIVLHAECSFWVVDTGTPRLKWPHITLVGARLCSANQLASLSAFIDVSRLPAALSTVFIARRQDDVFAGLKDEECMPYIPCGNSEAVKRATLPLIAVQKSWFWREKEAQPGLRGLHQRLSCCSSRSFSSGRWKADWSAPVAWSTARQC